MNIDAIQTAASQSNQALKQLSSGSRINSASDDAAGAAIANRMEASISGQNQGIRNLNDGISLLQTATGGLGEIQEQLTRLNEIAVQAGSGILASSDRSQLQQEANQIMLSIQDGFDTMAFNGQPLFSGQSFGFFDGQDSNLVQTPDSESLLSGLQVDLSSQDTVQASISAISAVQDSLNSAQAQLGASSNALSSRVASLEQSNISQQASLSQVQDADFAKASADLIQSKIQQEVAIAIQVQANASEKLVTSLLK